MWAPLQGFMYGPPFANLRTCDRTSGERRDSGAAYPVVLLIPRSQSRDGGGRGFRGLGYYREFSN